MFEGIMLGLGVASLGVALAVLGLNHLQWRSIADDRESLGELERKVNAQLRQIARDHAAFTKLRDEVDRTSEDLDKALFEAFGPVVDAGIGRKPTILPFGRDDHSRN